MVHFKLMGMTLTHEQFAGKYLWTINPEEYEKVSSFREDWRMPIQLLQIAIEIGNHEAEIQARVTIDSIIESYRLMVLREKMEDALRAERQRVRV